VPAAAATAGFNTLALNSDFSQPQPTGWFGCIGSGPGHIWYAGIEGGDTLAAPCSTTGGTTRYNLVTDALTGTQALDLSFKSTDLMDGARRYTTIQTVDDQGSPPNACCVLGELFPYGFYMEATYRVATTPAVPLNAIGGTWWGFWQGGQGLAPYTNPHVTIEIDHPEQHGELFGTCCGNYGPDSDWAVLNWSGAGGGGYFPSDAYLNGYDTTAYHTYGVKVTTDGSSGLVVCSYVDNNQKGCNTFTSSNAAQYAERKYPILFAGLACYAPGSGLTSTCINRPISSIYQCNGNNVCIHFSSTFPANANPIINISGVTGASGINGSWQTQSWSSGTDWLLLWAANDPSESSRPIFNGTPTGGTANALSQIDLLVQSVRVWTCASWQSGPC